MFYQTETKPQSWRAVAIFEDREMMLYLNRSSTQVRAGFRAAFLDLLDDEERDQVKSISLQRWTGAPDSGRWVHQSSLPVPTEKLVQSA